MKVLIVLSITVVSASAFLTPQPQSFRPSTRVAAAKGFGKTEEKRKPAREPTEQPVVNEVSASTPQPPAPAPMNAGQRALEQMRRERAEQRNAELQRARDMLKQDEQVQEAAAAIPEQVAMRMGQRMLPFVGIPLFLGMGAFVGFWYFATYRDMSFEPSMVAASTILILVVGLLGITYSVMSTSWDPDRQGSLLGADEFSKNVDNIKEGLSRSRENAALREKLAVDQDMQRELSQLDQAEAKAKRGRESLDAKLRDELE